MGQMMPEGLPEGVVNAATGFAVDGVTLPFGIGGEIVWHGSITTNGTRVTLTNSIYKYKYLLVIGTPNYWSTHYATSVFLPVSGSTSGGGEAWVVSDSDSNGLGKIMLSAETTIVFRFDTPTSLLSVDGFSAYGKLRTIYGFK